MAEETQNIGINPGDDDDELMQQLSAATQYKEPVIKKADEWDFDADETTVNKIQSEQEKTTIQTPAAPGADQNVKPEVKTGKATDAAKRASARTAIGMLDLTQKSIFTPLITYKYKKKFTAEEQERLIELEHKDKKKLEPEDLSLSNKFDRLMGRMNKKIEAIPLDKDEKKDLEEAFFTYFDAKEKTLPPEWFMYMAVTNAIGKRAIDAFTD